MPSWFRRWLRRSPVTTRRTTGRFRPRMEGLEDRCLLAAPVIDPINTVPGNVPVGKTLIVPVTANDSDGDALTYTVTSNNPQITANFTSGNTYLRISVQNFGDLDFQLFNDRTPVTVQTITDLVNRGFYDGLTFHRIVRDFVIQGGDPQGNGTGGPGFSFNDEFHRDLIFTGNGQLAMANSGKDTNGSQFFVTIGPERHLDFNHTIYGQLVRGFGVLTAINSQPTDANGRPVSPVVITSARVIQDTTDAVMTVRASGAGSATLTVTARDANGETDTETYQVTAAADTTNDPPFLGPVSNQSTPRNTPVTVTLTSTDLENDPVTFSATVLSTPPNGTVVVNGNQVTFTPTPGFTGTVDLQAAVQQNGATSRGTTADPRDTQRFTVVVTNTDAPLTSQPRGLQGTAGVPLTDVVVATFTDADPTATETSNTATINWGDNSTTAGRIRRASAGGFEVVGSHTYASAGNFAVTTTITGANLPEGASPSTTTANGVAAITAAPTTPPTTPPVTTPPTVTVPTPPANLTPNQRVVWLMYRDLLQRQPEAEALQGHAALLDGGAVTPQQLAFAIATSFERRFVEVNTIYLQLLGRPADPVGLQGGMQHLLAGGRADELRIIVSSSPEYIQARAGGDPGRYLDALYRDAFNTGVDPQGLAGFGTALQLGVPHFFVAHAVYNSPFYHDVQVALAYQALLRRQAEQAAIDHFSSQLDAGGRHEALLAGLLASDEYRSQ